MTRDESRIFAFFQVTLDSRALAFLLLERGLRHTQRWRTLPPSGMMYADSQLMRSSLFSMLQPKVCKYSDRALLRNILIRMAIKPDQ